MPLSLPTTKISNWGTLTVINPTTTDGPPLPIAEQFAPTETKGRRFSGSGVVIGNGQLLTNPSLILGTSGKHIVHFRFKLNSSGILFSQFENIAVDIKEFSIEFLSANRILAKWHDAVTGDSIEVKSNDITTALIYKATDWNTYTIVIDLFGAGPFKTTAYLNGFPLDDPIGPGYENRDTITGLGVATFNGGSLVSEFSVGSYASNSVDPNWWSGDLGQLKIWNNESASDSDILDLVSSENLEIANPIPSTNTCSADERPFFLNKIKIKMLLLSRGDRLTDTSPTPVVIKRRRSNRYFRAPQGKKIYGSAAGKDIPKDFECQVSYKETEMRELSNQGDHAVSSGHLVFRKKDLCEIDNEDEIPRKGDRIVAIFDKTVNGFRDVDYKVIHVTHKGHIGFNTLGVGGSITLKVFFTENKERVGTK